MNKTAKQSKTIQKPKEPVIVDVVAPVPANHYDQRYIEAYCNNPKAGKKQAIIDAGYVGKYASQEAFKIHKRVAEQIENRIKSFKQDIALLSYYQLKSMLKQDADKVGYSNMNAALKNGLDYTGHKPTDKLEVIEREQSLEELELEIAENERLLNEQRTH